VSVDRHPAISSDGASSSAQQRRRDGQRIWRDEMCRWRDELPPSL
jgi:hypothetical protein